MIRLIGIAAILALIYAAVRSDPVPAPSAADMHLLEQCEWASADRSNGADYWTPCAAALAALPAGACRSYALGMRNADPDGMRYFSKCLESVKAD